MSNSRNRFAFEVRVNLMDDLNVYAKIYEQTYGEKQTVSALIPSMLAGFLASDHGFKRAKRELG